MKTALFLDADQSSKLCALATCLKAEVGCDFAYDQDGKALFVKLIGPNFDNPTSFESPFRKHCISAHFHPDFIYSDAKYRSISGDDIQSTDTMNSDQWNLVITSNGIWSYRWNVKLRSLWNDLFEKYSDQKELLHNEIELLRDVLSNNAAMYGACLDGINLGEDFEYFPKNLKYNLKKYIQLMSSHILTYGNEKNDDYIGVGVDIQWHPVGEDVNLQIDIEWKSSFMDLREDGEGKIFEMSIFNDKNTIMWAFVNAPVFA